jgi:putative RecB family exonuclease
VNGQAALAVLRAENHVSFSAITTYLQCPSAYEHRYVLDTPPSHRSGALAFGAAIHAALAHHYRRLVDGAQATSEELEAVFADDWRRELNHPVPVLFDRSETADGLLDLGVELLRTFHATVEQPHRVVGVEEPFSVELVDPLTGQIFDERLVGVFDAVVQDTNDDYSVVEHKTAGRRWSSERLATDLQLTAYSLAAPLVGLGPASIALNVLLKTKTPTVEVHHLDRTDNDRRDLVRLVSGVLTAIRAGAFFPRCDWHCRSCPFAGPCLAG